MAQVMGGGLNEYGGLRLPDDQMMNPERFRRNVENAPTHLREPSSWPAEMRTELGDDNGLTAARRHREQVVPSFRKLRAAIDEFNPDVILIWSKEQMENFGPDCMPPFCIYAYDDFMLSTTENRGATRHPAIWPDGGPAESLIKVHRPAAKYLAAKLTDEGFDVAYSYKPLHVQLAHTFGGLLT